MQKDVVEVNASVQVRRKEDMVKEGLLINIPQEYGFSFPLKTIEEVQKFSDDLFVNNLKDEVGRVRDRRLEMVSYVESYNYFGCFEI